MKKLTFLLFMTSLLSCSAPKTVKIACVGDSITYGAFIKNREQNCYPAQLQRLLGDRYIVQNFGKNVATLLKKGNLSYVESPEYEQALQFKPDIVFIMLGTNDSKKINRVYLNEFEGDYSALIHSFKALSSHPRIVILKPIPAFNDADTVGITANVIAGKIVPLIEKTAFTNQCEIIDLFHYFRGQDSLLSDKVHPDSAGALRLAKRIRDVIELDTIQYDLMSRLEISGEKFNFHGFRGIKTMYQEVPVRLVQPKKTAKGKPWIWRARFFGHEPQTDLALLERGFHLAYCDVAGLFGAPLAVERWNQFYTYMRQMGLAKKVVLEGMSRGGLIVYNWAAVNPDKVACIYADAPVLDIKSWPGGKGKEKGGGTTWKSCKKVFGFTSEMEALNEQVSPVHHTGEIAKAGFPMLHVVGDADHVVPVDENSNPFAEKIKKYGGDITVIHKPGVDHHPHSLKNPEPIVNFILKATGKKID